MALRDLSQVADLTGKQGRGKVGEAIQTSGGVSGVTDLRGSAGPVGSSMANLQGGVASGVGSLSGRPPETAAKVPDQVGSAVGSLSGRAPRGAAGKK